MKQSTILCGVVFVVCIFNSFYFAEGVICPWRDGNYENYSITPAWNVRNASVYIPAGRRVLFDISAIELASLNISGTLIFPDQRKNVSAGWIRINSGGSLIIGSSDACRVLNKINITLTGTRTTQSLMGADPFDGTNLGAKGIAVATGGTLSLWGRDKKPTWTRLAKNANPGDSVIYVDDAVPWLWGDKIVLATTDFSEVVDLSNISSTSSLSWMRGAYFPNQNEVVTVSSVNGTKITLQEKLQYLHWGSGYEKGEVGLLTHNILIQGDDASLSDKFGGHFIMRNANVSVTGVEFTKMGQKGVMGRYPVHFHNAKNCVGKGYFARDNSIHDVFQRCVVIHGTDGIEVSGNVAFNTYGHCYFLEDGAEQSNVFDRNLGINARGVANVPEDPLQLIPTDSAPSVFWVTNPNNTWTNNVAVGGKFGYWFALPDKVMGLNAAAFANDPWCRPRCIPLKRFDNNVAHSAVSRGIQIDDMLNNDGTIGSSGMYVPTQGPFDPNKVCNNQGPRVEAQFNGITAYKNRGHGMWVKVDLRFNNAKILDNRFGFMGQGFSLLENSIVVGESANIGTPRIPAHSRSYADIYGGNNSHIQGFEAYDNGGPQLCKNNVFYNFTVTPFRKAGAYGSRIDAPFMVRTLNKFLNNTFINSNYIWFNYSYNDAQYSYASLDTDGTATGITGGGWIMANNTCLAGSSSCIWKPEWNGYFCPPSEESYVQVEIDDLTGIPNRTDVNGVTWTYPYGSRVWYAKYYELGNAAHNTTSLGHTTDCDRGAAACYQYLSDLTTRRGYTVRFGINDHQQPTPNYLKVMWLSPGPGDYLYFAVPYPPSALPFNISRASGPMTAVSSFDKIVDETTYYWDVTTEHLYFKFVDDDDGSASGTDLNDKWGFATYQGSTDAVTIRASCTRCVPTKLGIPSMPSNGVVEEKYRADLQRCQIPGYSATTGTGSAFFWYYPATRELHYSVYHDLSLTATKISLTNASLLLKATGSTGFEITSKPFATAMAYARGVFVLSYDQWVLLLTGKLNIVVSTTAFPNGHIRGQIRSSSANPQIPPMRTKIVSPCAPTYGYFPMFNESVVSPFTNFSNLYASESVDWTNTQNAYCGQTSIKANISQATIGIGTVANNKNAWLIDPAVYKYLEFFIRAEDGQTVDLSVGLRDKPGNLIGTVDLLPKYVYNYIVDPLWTRVRVPLADLGLVKATNLSRVFFNNNDVKSWKTFYVDEIRFIQNFGVEPNDTQVQQSQIKKYSANCVCTDTNTGVNMQNVQGDTLVFDTNIGSDNFDVNGFADNVANLTGINSTWLDIQSTQLSKRSNDYNVVFSIIPPRKNLLKFVANANKYIEKAFGNVHQLATQLKVDYISLNSITNQTIMFTEEVPPAQQPEITSEASTISFIRFFTLSVLIAFFVKINIFQTKRFFYLHISNSHSMTNPPYYPMMTSIAFFSHHHNFV